MAIYRVDFRGSAQRELDRLDRHIIARVIEAIDRLGEQPRPIGVRKLGGADNTYRVRVGEYRIVYTIDDSRQIVTIDRVRHRSDACR